MPVISTLAELAVTSVSSLQQRHWTQHILIIQSVHICISEALELMAHSCQSYPGFCSMKRLGVFLIPLDGMPVHHRSPPYPPQFVRFPQQFTATHLYSWERGTVRVKRLAQEHNTVSPTRARTQTPCSRDACTNHTCIHILYWLSRII